MKTLVTLCLSGSALVLVSSSAALAAQSGDAFLKSAIQGDDGEIMLGQLAAQKGSTNAVRQFGQTLVKDHTDAKQNAMQLAKQMNLQLDDQPTADANGMKDKLSGLSGAAFDKAFADGMVEDHQKDIAAYKDVAASVQGPVSALAAKTLPTLEKHLQMAQKLAGMDKQAAASGPTAAAATSGATASMADGGFLNQEGDQLWRGSKLIGVNIYGPQDKKVGDVNDVLVGHDGKIGYLVIGVGGFLGMGEKNVAVPFDKVRFTQEPLPGMMPNNAASASAGQSATMEVPGVGLAPNPVPGAGTPGDALGTPSVPVGDKPAMAGMQAAVPAVAAPPAPAQSNAAAAPVMPRSSAYPDHGTVDYTADQLKAAPDFKYAK